MEINSDVLIAFVCGMLVMYMLGSCGGGDLGSRLGWGIGNSSKNCTITATFERPVASDKAMVQDIKITLDTNQVVVIPNVKFEKGKSLVKKEVTFKRSSVTAPQFVKSINYKSDITSSVAVTLKPPGATPQTSKALLQKSSVLISVENITYM
jgi:hypothetical protein